MRLFLVSFFLLYSVLHLYVFLKTRKTVSLNKPIKVLLILFMALMIFSPVIVRYSENYGYELFARSMSYAGYIWMGFLFLFVSLSFVLDILKLLLNVSKLIIQKEFLFFIPYRKISFYLCLAFAILVSVYGYFEAQEIRTEKITIKTSKLPEGMGILRIVQISDVHLGLIVREARLKKIIAAVRESRPDILVSTGDLVDGQINKLDGLSDLLNEINPRYGKYAITGNHEYYAGLAQALDFTEKSGFRILRGESVNISDVIQITGVDDQAGRFYNLNIDVSETDLLSKIDNNNFILLLKHRPLLEKSAIDLFDLQLSGHTHKGQIFPFGLFTHIYYPHDSGYKMLRDNSHLYVSRGTGTWGPPVRFLSPPEITVIDLVQD